MADQFIGTVLADKYRIESLIGADGLGGFYHGTHVGMDKPVSVKILSPALAVDDTIAKKFAAEARTISRISHPNILNVTDYGSDSGGAFFIVYEDASGETLKDVIERAGKFSLERANHIVKQAAAALSVAHANAIVHRDLMSDNILIRRTPSDAEEVKIYNFSVDPKSELDDHDPDLAERAKYASPEAINSPAEIDERTDVYSLGIVLYEMLAGEVPFTAEKPTDTLLKQVQDMPPPIGAFRTDLPKEIDEVLLKALTKKAQSRYQTVNALADSFNRITQLHQATVAKMIAGAAPSEPNNNIWKTAFIVLVGAVLIGGLFIYMTGSGKQTAPGTQLQPDANSIPVQPLNPSTGSTEQMYSNMNTYTPGDLSGNSNGAGINPGGDYGNPYWQNGKVPPGAPPGNYVPYGGNTVYLDPCQSNSQFMPQDCNQTVNVPVNRNRNANVAANVNRNSNPANANVSTPTNTGVKPTPPPGNTSAPPKTTSTPGKPKASPQPKNSPPPSATEKRPQSGKIQDTL